MRAKKPGRGQRVFALIGVTLAVLVGGTACKRLEHPPQVRLAPVPEEPAKLPMLEIFVDDSESMQGFVRGGDSAYQKAMTTLIEKSLTAGYPRAVVPLSAVGDAARMPRSGQITMGYLLSADFYRGKETPLATLLDRVAKGPGDRVTVIVTDLVQSEKARSQHDFIEAFRRAAAVRPEVLLLGFRSAFRGTYYVETQPSDWDAYPLNFDGRSPRTSRPFYLLILAPADALPQFRRYVLEHLGADGVFHASEPPVTFSKVELDGQGAYGLYQPIEASTGFQRGEFLGTFVERSKGRDGKNELRLRVTGECRLPLHSATNLKLDVKKREPKTGEWIDSGPAHVAVDGGTDAASGEWRTPGPLSATIVYQFPRPELLAWDVYRVRVRAGRTNVGAPAWVTEWSTRDDRPLAAGHLTLNLNLLVEAMIRGITEETTWTDHVVRIARER